MTNQRLAGRYILITGGGGGIGMALAKGLTDLGAKVFVADVRDEAASTSGGWTSNHRRLMLL